MDASSEEGTPGEAAATAVPDAVSASRAAIIESDTVSILEFDGRTVYLVGTAHVSDRSVDEVERVIEAVRPDTVCVELCKARYDALTDENRWSKLDIFEVIRGGKTLFLLANLAVGAYQRRLGAELGVKPGAELLAAARKGESVGAELALVDRDIHITLKRTWGNIGFVQKAKLLGAIVTSLFASKEDGEQLDIEELKDKANLSEMMSEFARLFPEVKRPLIDERDEYLMQGIEDAPGETVVAVVGAAHVEGMKTHLGVPLDKARLEELPKKKWFWSLVKWLIPAAMLAAFAVGFADQEGKSLQEMIFAWVLPNGVVAALFTALAGGKFVSVVVAFVASPITSLNPAIGAGMVVGVVEAWLRKPRVADAEAIADDVQSFRGFYRNAFTRVLLVAVASSLGSAIGAFIGASWVLSLLPT